MKQQHIVTAAVVLASAGVVVVLFVLSGPSAPAPAPKAEVAAPSPAAPPAVAEPEVIVMTPPVPTEEEMKEIRYLPENAALPATLESRILALRQMREGNRRLVGVRALTNKATHGDLLNPQWSPDGLQILATRPGFDGLFVLDVRTGTLRRVADANGFGARWTAEGNIEARNADGRTLLYAPDGTLLGEAPRSASVASVENDTVFVNGPDGTRVPITTREDKFFNPVVSPDGKQVVFQGLTSGLYVAPVDGSAPPVSIGYGNNPTWMPDGSGLLFDMTTDDGHVLTEGDILMVDSKLEEVNHLTKGDGLIGQRPSVRPDSGEVAFEAEGELFVGTLQ